jgi:hypothetical protein
MREQRELPGIVRSMTVTITLVVVVAVVAGIGTAALGGSLTNHVGYANVARMVDSCANVWWGNKEPNAPDHHQGDKATTEPAPR